MENLAVLSGTTTEQTSNEPITVKIQNPDAVLGNLTAGRLDKVAEYHC